MHGAASELLKALQEIADRDPCTDPPEACTHGVDGIGCIGCVARRAIRKTIGNASRRLDRRVPDSQDEGIGCAEPSETRGALHATPRNQSEALINPRKAKVGQ